jgi:hypothetical protein
MYVVPFIDSRPSTSPVIIVQSRSKWSGAARHDELDNSDWIKFASLELIRTTLEDDQHLVNTPFNTSSPGLSA